VWIGLRLHGQIFAPKISAFTASMWIIRERNPTFASQKNLPRQKCLPKKTAMIKCHPKIPATTKMPLKKL